ncbi:MAG: tetratricopeptide repeat protein [Xanthobacteraceae bacterium]|jgi:TPR repeat protein
MRIGIWIALLVTCGLAQAGAVESGLPSLASTAPIDCIHSGHYALLPALQRAAEGGDLMAQSTLGCMYARGQGVPRRDAKAFEFFSRIADEHADDAPDLPRARVVASAFVALGQFYLRGIEDADLKADPARARDLFAYAAAYFGDPDAQYYLARLCLDGNGMAREPLLAARWLGLAANKGQHRAQAVLGFLLFRGGAVPRQVAPGLMWLTLARDAAGPDDGWISDAYDAAFSAANEVDRAAALQLLERHLRERAY